MFRGPPPSETFPGPLTPLIHVCTHVCVCVVSASMFMWGEGHTGPRQSAAPAPKNRWALWVTEATGRKTCSTQCSGFWPRAENWLQ